MRHKGKSESSQVHDVQRWLSSDAGGSSHLASAVHGGGSCSGNAAAFVALLGEGGKQAVSLDGRHINANKKRNEEPFTARLRNGPAVFVALQSCLGNVCLLLL